MKPDDLTPLIRGSYDRWAPDYVAKFGDELDRKPFDRDQLEAFAARAAHTGLVLDVGCGPGQIGAYVSAHGCGVAGLDLSFGMLRESHRRQPEMALVQASMLSLPLKNASLAGVVAFYAIIHLREADVAVALSEFARVTKPGAPMLIAVHEGQGDIHVDLPLDSVPGESVPMYALWFQEEPLRHAVEAAGFTIESVRTRGPYAFEQTKRIYVMATRAVAPVR